MKHLAAPQAVIAGCVLIAATNLGILGSAAWNRRGEPTAELTLTERELALPEGRQEERGGILLGLKLADQPPGPVERTARWRGVTLPRLDHPWLDRAKLDELGFRTGFDPADPHAVERWGDPSPRTAWLVLEYDGPAWELWMRQREQAVEELRGRVESGAEKPVALADAEALLELDRAMRSRLVPVDAGRDPGALLERYPDRRRYAVIQGLVGLTVSTSEAGVPALGGRLLGTGVGSVHVPRELSAHLEPLLAEETFHDMEMRERREAQDGWPAPRPPRYRADLAVGRRFEPWLRDVTVLD